MPLKEFRRKILRALGLSLSGFLITVLCRSLRLSVVNGEIVNSLLKENKNFVLAFWHGKMLLPWYLHGRENFSALVSQSKDGDILTRLLEKWNYKVIRGSSNIGGKEALEILVDLAANGYSVAITPDGPTGPAKKMKPGAVVTAKKTGIPLVLAGVHHQKKYLMKSWDKFEVPKFFSKAAVEYSGPFYINSGLSREETTVLINEYENKLNELERSAALAC